MRLIDADKLEKEMNDLCGGECDNCRLPDCPVYSQPTAYDVDKVVEQLEELNPFNGCCSCEYWEKCRELRKNHNVLDNVNSCALTIKHVAMEIVKSGGI